MSKSNIALIGLGTMGAALAKNIANHGYRISVWNRTFEKIAEFAAEASNENIYTPTGFEDFIESIERPRKIIIMVTAGDALQDTIQKLLPALEPGDILIDGGNSLFRDTEMIQNELLPKDIYFIGMGVSGGEAGALKGPSIMFGGDFDASQELEAILKSIAANDFSGGSCAEYMGVGGSGHYVKMVHNGIEYAEMQMIAEAYDLLREVYKLKNSEIADIFETFAAGELSSFLLETAVSVLRTKENSQDLVELILDKAEQKGTGKWTCEEALNLGIPAPSISAAVFMRAASTFKCERVNLSKKYNLQKNIPNLLNGDFIKELEKAMLITRIINFEQGFSILREASKIYHYGLNLSKIARIWQGGCIIRCKLLDQFSHSFKLGIQNLFEDEILKNTIVENYKSLQNIIKIAVDNNIPAAVFSAGLTHFTSSIRAELPTNLIQGMRDNFGSHGFERKI